MKIIAAKKNNIVYYGAISKIAKLIGVHPVTVGRWAKAKKDIEAVNGYEVYLNTEKL